MTKSFGMPGLHVNKKKREYVHFNEFERQKPSKDINNTWLKKPTE